MGYNIRLFALKSLLVAIYILKKAGGGRGIRTLGTTFAVLRTCVGWGKSRGVPDLAKQLISGKFVQIRDTCTPLARAFTLHRPHMRAAKLRKRASVLHGLSPEAAEALVVQR